MIYRKKIILSLIEVFGGELNATDFQKLLFLFSQKQSNSKYDFVPYKYGCFSFQVMADKGTLIKEGYLENAKNWTLTLKHPNFVFTLNDSDRKNLKQLKQTYSSYSTANLVRQVYINYPYFAIHSEIATKYLTEKEINIINRFKPQNEKPGLFTIGYEGKSLEKYLNILIRQNIKVLCDVRKNPLSRKYGFAKRTLKNACESVHIKYIHLPELGIASEKRKSLNNQSDYDNLFLDYEKTTLPFQEKAIKFIQDLVLTYKRVALTCYEAYPEQCHRTRVANSVQFLNKKTPLQHL